VWAGLTVDNAGMMNVVWADFNGNAGWQGPVPFGDARLVPGAPNPATKQARGCSAEV